MAAQSSNSSIATPGVLPNNDWGDYPTPQDALNAFMANTTFSIEGGATGATGETGDAGQDNDTTYEWILEKTVDVPAGVTSLNLGVALEGKILQLRAPEGTGVSMEQNFGIGVIENQTVNFVFNDQALTPEVPTPSVYTLEIWSLEVTIPAP